MRAISQILCITAVLVIQAACSGSGPGRDTTPPVITLTGANPLIIAVGEAYVEPGATATDDRDGDLTASIVINTSAVDSSIPGTYQVTYNVRDAAGNAAVTMIRIVTVNPPAPEQAQVTVVGDIKQLLFSWEEVPYTDFYRLLENPDGHSGFTQVGDDIPAGTLEVTRDIAVHLFSWIDAQYQIDACNVTGCSTSDVVTATDVMLDTIGYFKASNTDAKDHFGRTVALSADGQTLAVGSRYESSAATGIDGDQADNLAERAGAVYVFRNGSSGWSQVAYIKASNTEAYDGFGCDVALSGNGDTLVVGARWEDSSATGIGGDQSDNVADSAGAVYVFEFDGATWLQTAYVKPSNTEPLSYFGAAVAVSEDGAVMAVGAPMDWEQYAGRGVVYLFGLESDQWVEKQILDPPVATGEWFGEVIAFSGNGERLAVLKPEMRDADFPLNGVYVYRNSGDQWTLEILLESSNIEPGDRFGLGGIAFNDDGTVLAAGAPGESSSAGGINGDQNDNSAEAAGAAYVFRYDGETWNQQAYIKALNPGPGDLFGRPVALSADGRTLTVGDSPGAASVFAFDGTEWRHISYVNASNPDEGDRFPGDAALSGDGAVLAVGARGEGSAATGIGGDQNDNSAPYAGAVYIY